ncbi:hypothetical protein [Sphingobacterium sp. 1.A.5]|uniref:hypothetical protein n=1 Tax=Sphingobacterium sp. 1.A.5 TaxID=2044604 RepID=UPI000C0BE8A4|nr:hypothetical protein [Sphingobacterium sp. 1.A.5]
MKKIIEFAIPVIAFFLIALVILSPLWGISIYEYWTGFIDTNNRFEAIGTVIAYVGGVINIVTIAFLYINFHQQKEDNFKKDQELEYNRALDIVYRQLEFTNKRFKPINQKVNYNRYTNYINSPVREERNNNLKESYNIFLLNSHEILYFFQFLNKEFSAYKKLLNVRGLSHDHKLKLVYIILWNIDVKLESNIERFYTLYVDWSSKFDLSDKSDNVNNIILDVIKEAKKSLAFFKADFNE